MSEPVIAIDVSPLESARRTGVERLLLGAIRALDGRDDAARFLLVSRSPIDWPADLSGRFETRVVPGKRVSWWRERILPRALDALGVDLLHGPVTAIPIAGAFRRIATVHELSWKRAPGAEGLQRALVHRWRLRRVDRYADRILVPSEATRGDCIAYRPSLESRTVAIHPGIDARFACEPRDDPEPSSAATNARAAPNPGAEANPGAAANPGAEDDARIRGRYGLSNSGPYLLSVGSVRANRKKNPTRLLEVARAVSKRCGRDVPLVLVGDCGVRRAALEAAAERFGVRAILPGFVADEDLPALYRGAGVFVHASKSEGFGFPILEAMACGVPVVATDAGSIAEVAGGAASLHPADDSEGFAQAVVRLLEDRIVRVETRRRGLDRARSFSWSTFGASLWNLYLSALEDPRRS